MNKVTHYVRNKFITGILVVLPIVLTVWILITIFNWLDSILRPYLARFLNLDIPGLGLLITLVLVFYIGVFTSNVVGKKITYFFESIFLKLPIIRTVYSPIREVFQNFSHQNADNFKFPVLVEFPHKGSYSIGFITKEVITIAEKELTAVFIPTTPNPTNGFLVYLEKGQFTKLNVSIDVALKSVISLGSVSPKIMDERTLD